MSFRIVEPDQVTTGTIFASPHSGADYPGRFVRESLLDMRALRSSEDAFVDSLLDMVGEFGAPLIAARVPRAYVDLNRADDELDPALIEGLAPQGHNPRIASGLGVVPRVVSAGRVIRPGKITRAEAQARIDAHWHPYHQALRGLVDRARGQFGPVLLADMHSMPHEAVQHAAWPRGKRPQIVLGDRFGASAAPCIVDAIEAAFAGEGLIVSRNAPFAGAYVTQCYGRPGLGVHAVQIEIDRSLYMNEREITPSADFAVFRALIARVASRIADMGRSEKARLAAE